MFRQCGIVCFSLYYDTHLNRSHYAINNALLFYHCLILRELFSYSGVWCGIVPSLLAWALYITRQHYRKTVLEGEDNNMLSTQHPILKINEKNTQIQLYNNNSKMYNATLSK